MQIETKRIFLAAPTHCVGCSPGSHAWTTLVEGCPTGRGFFLTGANTTPVSIKQPKGFKGFTHERGAWSPPPGDQAANPSRSVPTEGQAVRDRLNAPKSDSKQRQNKPAPKPKPNAHVTAPRLNNGANGGRRARRNTGLIGHEKGEVFLLARGRGLGRRWRR